MSDSSIVDRIKYRQQHSVDPEEFLTDAGAIEPVDSDEALSFTDAFEGRLSNHIESVMDRGVEEADMAQLFGVNESEVRRVERPFVAFRIINTIRKWPSDAAAIFDVAVDSVFHDLTTEWADIPPRQRYRIAQSLRSFQETCLFCGDRITYDETPVESCCSERNVISLHCDGCDRRFLEFSADADDDGAFGEVRSRNDE